MGLCHGSPKTNTWCMHRPSVAAAEKRSSSSASLQHPAQELYDAGSHHTCPRGPDVTLVSSAVTFPLFESSLFIPDVGMNRGKDILWDVLP